MENKYSILAQYKIYVQTVNRMQEGYNRSHKFFILLLSFIIVLLALSYSENTSFLEGQTSKRFVIILGLGLNTLWFIGVRSFRQMFLGKFKVLREMEKYLPFQCFDREWEIIGIKNNILKYWPIPIIEQNIPVIFVLLFVYLLIVLKWDISLQTNLLLNEHNIIQTFVERSSTLLVQVFHVRGAYGTTWTEAIRAHFPTTWVVTHIVVTTPYVIGITYVTNMLQQKKVYHEPTKKPDTDFHGVSYPTLLTGHTDLLWKTQQKKFSSSRN